MKFPKHILPILSLAALMACSEDLPQPQIPHFEVLGEKLNVDVSLSIADMSEASTRAFGESPDYNNLKLYVVEFKYDETGGPLSDGSVITKIYTDSISNEAPNATDGDIHFNITLDKIDEPRVLHFISVPKTTELTIPYELSLEGSVIPALRVEDNTPAYWQRVVFPHGYGSFSGADNKWTTDETEMRKLQHIPMIRNFAKISLMVSASGFTLDGFMILNQPKSGYIAPWNTETSSFPTLNDGESMLSYSDIDAVYKGYSPGNQVIEINLMSVNASDTEPKYIYERPNSSINFPLILLRGHRANGKTMYYKLDLGRSVNNDPFKFYDILRNFEYAIDITKIDADGYDSPREAYEGVVFNNFSFDVNTSKMLNVSNGQDMLWVNQTTFVVTNPNQTDVTFLFRYRTGITADGGGTNANDSVQLLGLEKGEAIEEYNVSTSDTSDGWRQVTIKTPTPTTARKMQEFVVYNPASGLGRTIRIVVRSPWYYTDDGVWGGNYNYYDQFIDAGEEREKWNGFVSSNEGTGHPLTVRFHIDDNIPEALFPLEFTFESDRQNIENNKYGNLLVKYGSSFFDNTKITLKYVKTVTWADYNSDLTKDNETGTIVDDDNDGITSHVVRARFQTILPIQTDSVTTIRVYNEYNRVPGDESPYLDVTFTGKEGEAPNYAPEDEPTNNTDE